MINFGIPGFIFQAKITKFGANVGLNMLINISPGFYHIRKKWAIVFRIFQQQKAKKLFVWESIEKAFGFERPFPGYMYLT